MDRSELRPRTLTGQPSPLHPHRPHRLRPGRRGPLRHRRGPRGVDAVVHLAAIPGATFAPNVATFDNNLVSTFHVFQAAKLFNIHNLVWASSETLLGYPFHNPPAYVPLDENVPPTPEVVYALAKDLEEEMARQYCRWNPNQKMIGLRFSNVIDTSEYADFPSFENDPASRKWNLWSYIDARDGAQAVMRALEYDKPGFDNFVIANARHRHEPAIEGTDGRVLPRDRVPRSG